MTVLVPGKALRVAFGETIADLARTDPRIIVLDGDTGSSTRTDIFENEHPDRFFQMGITEQNMLGMAAGMATLGLIPIVSTFSCFIVSRGHDPIRVLIAQPKLNVKMMGGYAGLLAGMTGKTHLMFDDISIMRAMANMTVVAPADEVETRQALAAIIDYPGPVYVRLTRPNSPILFDHSYRFEIGKAVTVQRRDRCDRVRDRHSDLAGHSKRPRFSPKRESVCIWCTSRPSSHSTQKRWLPRLARRAW